MYSSLPGFHRAFPGPLSTQRRTQRPHTPLLGGPTISGMSYGRLHEGAAAPKPMPQPRGATYGASVTEPDLTAHSNSASLGYEKRYNHPRTRKFVHTPLLGGATISGLSYGKGEGYQQPRKQDPIGTRPMPQQSRARYSGMVGGGKFQPPLSPFGVIYSTQANSDEHSLDLPAPKAPAGHTQHNCTCPSCLLASLYAAESSINSRAPHNASYSSSMYSPPHQQSKAAHAGSPFSPETMATKLLEDDLEDDMLLLYRRKTIVVQIEPKIPRPTSVTKSTIRALEAQAEKEVQKQEREFAMNALAKSLQGFQFGDPPLQEDDYDEGVQEVLTPPSNPFPDFQFDELYMTR